ncbi:vegetative cell wall protein gp1-like [Drosophila subpulchrella]|uniref:vegetative cell wall protein gp1-like n=1 Tax=Drosophila subpulchrella TaxID=1486046 RepID=UPI0018A19082|nr:vegetative cell wall protein gp1-like [Drosophila subpulchrella]
MAEEATRPRSGLQPEVAQRHERRHAGSKESLQFGARPAHTAPRAAPTERPSSAQQAPSERRQCTTSGTHPALPPGARTARPPRPQQRHPRRQPRYQQRRPSSVPRRAVPPTWPSGAHRAPPAAPTTAPDTWSPATQRASPGARNERARALSSVQRPSGGVICTTSSTHRVPTECPPSATSSAHSSAHQQRPAAPSAAPTAPTAPDTWSLATLRAPPGPRNERPPRPQQRPSRRQQRRPRGNGSASRNHIGPPLPHVSSTCRAPLVAPSAQSRH